MAVGATDHFPPNYSIQEKARDKINKMNQIQHRNMNGRAVVAL